MSMEAKVVTVLIKYLWCKYPYLMKEIVIGPNAHVHRNPKKVKPTPIVEVSHAEG